MGKNRIIGQVGKHPQWNGATVYMFQVVMKMRVKRSPTSSVRSLFWPEMKYSFNDSSPGKEEKIGEKQNGKAY